MRARVSCPALLLASALTGGALIAAVPAGAEPVAGSAPALYGAAAGGPVIVRLRAKSPAGPAMRSAATRTQVRDTQRPVVDEITAHGGRGLTQLVSVNAVAATVSAAEVRRLQADPAVAQIVPDAAMTVQVRSSSPQAKPAKLDQQLCPTDPAEPLLEPEALSVTRTETDNAADPDQASKVATGKGVVVSIDGMNELAGNPNFQRADGSHVVIDAPDYSADHSDGEYYGDASSVAAQGLVTYDYSRELPYSGLPAGCTFRIKGLAPDASLVDTSLTEAAVDANGVQTRRESQVVAGIEHATLVEHADVMSESYGYRQQPGLYSVFYAANDAAVAAGVTVVVSSGDSGVSGTVSSPATDPLVIAAGATNTLRLNAQAYGYTKWTNNDITPLSSGGTAPNNRVVDLVAPGYGGEAACSPNGSDCPTNTLTEAFGGTSQACPLIAAGAADVIQAYADSHGGTKPTPALVKQILIGSARDVHAPADQQGAGLLDVYAAVRAAQQAPGGNGGATDAPSLTPSAPQLDLTGAAGSTVFRTVSLYNASNQATTVTPSTRVLGTASPVGKTVTETVSAPANGAPIPAQGAVAATPITFRVPAGLDRLSADMIVPDPTNSAILSFTLTDPSGGLRQISYDYGTGPTRAGQTIGTTPNIQHVEVADPQRGLWTATPRWANGRAHLQDPPTVPGTYRGTVSFRATGARYVTASAGASVRIAAHASGTVKVRIPFPTAPGDHPASIQFGATNGAMLSYPVARRVLLPAAGGTFDTPITSTVGRGVGQISTYWFDVAAGHRDLNLNFHTADANPDNRFSFFLIDPTGTVVARDATPSTTVQGIGSGTPSGDAALFAANPVPGRWEVDVELNLTVSGQEFDQTVSGTLGYDRSAVTVYSLPTSTNTTIPAGGSAPVRLGVTNPTSVGRTFSLAASGPDLTGTAPVYLAPGASALLTATLTPTEPAGTTVQGTLRVVMNTSATSPFSTQTVAALPYAFTVAAATG